MNVPPAGVSLQAWLLADGQHSTGHHRGPGEFFNQLGRESELPSRTSPLHVDDLLDVIAGMQALQDALSGVVSGALQAPIEAQLST